MKNIFAKKKLIVFILMSSMTFLAFDRGERFFEIAKNLDIYATLFKELNTYYVDEINPNRAIKTSIDAMLKTFDPYTVYYAEDEIEDYMTMTTGKYSGIGVSVASREGKHQVMMVFEGSPAEKAGMKIGDEILKIDGIDVVNSNKYDVGTLLKGQNGTNVKLAIKRYGQTKPQDLVVGRDVVKTGNVHYYGMINDEVGYIDLKDFTATASREMKDAFKALKDKGMKKLVIDLRENPGGLMQMAIEICNMFVEKDNLIVSTKGKVLEWNKDYNAMAAAIDTEMPIIAITNSRSASAAEIVAGTIQDYDRGVLLGQRSFGKGLVQVTRDLSYNAKFKVTTAKYYIASGRCIQALDYSHRNTDGSVGKVADSLKTAFKTKNGRTVYDGGGVMPDVEVEKAAISTVGMNLTLKGLLFEYANKYHFDHPTIKPAKEFALTETEYQDFVKWLATKDFTYTTQVEKEMANLEASAQKEKYLDALQEQLKALKAKIKNQKVADLQTFKEEIRASLEEEIIVHYYLQKGTREHSFARDPEIQASLKLFGDMNRYRAILKGSK
jgi:carboxyl-terminal processing protease